MYLILLKDRKRLGETENHVFTSVFTDSILDVAQAFRDAPGEVKVFKLESLTQVKEIDIQIQEITEETSDG